MNRKGIIGILIVAGIEESNPPHPESADILENVVEDGVGIDATPLVAGTDPAEGSAFQVSLGAGLDSVEVDLIDLDSLLDSDDALSLSGLMELRPRVTVGRVDGPRAEVFGLINDIEVHPDGTILVADERMLEIKVLNNVGDYLSHVGRPGSGPGEFRHLTSLELDRNNRLFALDGRLRRITQYALRDSVLESVDEFSFPLLASDLCILGERFFINGLNHDQVIHEISPSGSVLNSFSSALTNNLNSS